MKRFLLFPACFILAATGWTSTIDWGGATSAIWTNDANWFSAIAPTSADNVAIGVNQSSTTNVLDLAGTIAALASTSATSPFLHGASVYALEFSNQGGVTNYTVQNGTITTSTTIGGGEGYVKVDTNITVNLNVSVGGFARIIELADGATLNIGAGVTAANRLVVYGSDNAVAKLFVNATNYSPTNHWVVGPPTTGSVSNYVEDLTVYVNASQNITGDSAGANNGDVNIGWAAAGHENKLVIRNGAGVKTDGRTSMGGPNGGVSPGNGRLVIGDASTKGYFTNSSVAGRFRIGNGVGTGIIDVFNGMLVLRNSDTNKLGHGGQSTSTGIINLYTNGTILTASFFQLASGANPGNAVINFLGGTMQYNSSALSNLFDASVSVFLTDAGGTIDTNGKTTNSTSGLPIGFSAPILNSGSGIGTLKIINSFGNGGRLAMSGINTYAGPTLVQQQANSIVLSLVGDGTLTNSTFINLSGPSAILDVTGRTDGTLTILNGKKLMGSGVVAGTTVIQPGGIVQPGSTSTGGMAIGNLTISNNITLSGSTVIALNTANEVVTSTNVVVGSVTNTLFLTNIVNSSKLTVLGTAARGGTLVLTNIGPALKAGDVFTNFAIASGSGSFANIVLPQLGFGLGWVTSNLLVNGTSQVITTQSVNPIPTNIVFSTSSSNLVLSWPLDHTGWRLLQQTNHLATGISTNLSDWATVGNSASTNQVVLPINTAKPTTFYRMVYP